MSIISTLPTSTAELYLLSPRLFADALSCKCCCSTADSHILTAGNAFQEGAADISLWKYVSLPNYKPTVFSIPSYDLPHHAIVTRGMHFWNHSNLDHYLPTPLQLCILDYIGLEDLSLKMKPCRNIGLEGT